MAEERRVPLQTILARPGLVVEGEYKILKKICEGEFGVVCKAFNIPDGKEVVLKFEKEAEVLSDVSQLHLERMVYHKLSYRYCPGTRFMTGKGGVLEGHRFLVLDLLGPSLGTLFVTSPERFTVKNVMLLGYELVTQLERLHSVGFIHRDIKPENICVGHGSASDQIHLIDFGMAKRYVRKEDGRRVSLPNGKSNEFYGNSLFCSVNALNGREQSRRDDLEALAYLLIYFLKGTLPWKLEDGDDLIKIKTSTSPKTICKNLPKEIYAFLSYVKELDFQEKPNYEMIRGFFAQALSTGRSLTDEDFKIDLVPQPTSSNGNAAAPSKKRKRTDK